ncbi:multiple sugar transport system substrate-binding protein [Paenibacillus taihuensis]|uniref:Multiple sugar transport system substrate-binding protein n=1 Tax=Paenibacillus taihuensis TaxID=1156355 RepID=A0A3D9SQH8_9BACL|nr:extracellular solute-binding protein [Paenibacillus taihuensis]REE92941.1 multiple sugar transport system substrate-binding protein [Paenibacillus taihuensis]
MERRENRKRVVMKRTAAAAISTLMITSTLAACTKGESDSDADRHVLRVGFMYSNSDNDPYLRQQFTDSYELLHPNIDIEIVSAINYDDQRFDQPDPNKPQPDPYEKMKEMLTGSNPADVVILESAYLKRAVQDNLLKQLDPIIQEDEFDIDDFVPTVINGIKDAGDGYLYALTPTFSGSALFYNKKLFNDAGVSLPSDNMQWPDVIALAKRLAKGDGQDRKFGIAFNRWGGDPFYDSQSYAAPLQLKMFDNKAEKMTVDQPQWRKVWNDLAGLYKEKIVPTGQDLGGGGGRPLDVAGASAGKEVYDPFQGDLFINGRLAMTVAGYDYVNELAKAKDYAAKNNKPAVDWDVVTVPQFQEAPGIGGNIYLSNLMAINNKAQNPDDAWDFIRFNNSKEWAKLKSRSTYEMVSRKSFLKPKEGMSYNIDAFYALKPVPPQDVELDKLYRDRPNLYQVQNLAQPLFQDIIQGKKSVEDALKEWQTKGDALLQKIKDNPSGPLDPVGGVGVGGDVYVNPGGAVKG